MRQKKQRGRLWHLGGLYALGLVFLGVGLFWRQGVQAQRYQLEEKRQSQRRILQPGPRGNIYDRNGVLLVGNRPGFSVVLYLNELRSQLRQAYYKNVREAREQGLKTNRDELRDLARQQVARGYLDKLQAILGRELTLDTVSLKKHFAQRLLLPFALVKDLSQQEYALLLDTLAPQDPMQLHTDALRYYPYGSVASHVLGVLGPAEAVPDDLPDKDLTTFSFKSQSGRSGLEFAFDTHLQGESGGSIWQVDPSGFQYRCLEHKDPRQGKDLSISLDVELQRVAEDALGDRKAAALMLDVATGEVLVMASKPDYDLNCFVPSLSTQAFEDISQRGAWINRALQGLYPPGSPYKLISAMAALKSKAITRDTVFDCGRTFMVGSRAYPEHDGLSLGPIGLGWAIGISSNVYFYQAALKMGPQALADETRFWRLDQPTGIELPFEPTALVAPDPAWKRSRRKEAWYPGDTANTAIGQGFLLTTPLRMACFAAALGRGDPDFTPTILHRPGKTLPPPCPGAHGLSPEDYDAILDGMRQSATRGTGRLVSIPDSDICVKTGTAQIANNTMTLAWLIGFYYPKNTPSELPAIALCVLVESSTPQDTLAGSTTASPIARTLIRAYQKAYEPEQPAQAPAMPEL